MRRKDSEKCTWVFQSKCFIQNNTGLVFFSCTVNYSTGVVLFTQLACKYGIPHLYNLELATCRSEVF
eukprot:Gb_14674 [translate_table: standard]